MKIMVIEFDNIYINKTETEHFNLLKNLTNIAQHFFDTICRFSLGFVLFRTQLKFTVRWQDVCTIYYIWIYLFCTLYTTFYQDGWMGGWHLDDSIAWKQT